VLDKFRFLLSEKVKDEGKQFFGRRRAQEKWRGKMIHDLEMGRSGGSGASET